MPFLTPHIIGREQWTPKLFDLRDKILSGLGSIGSGLPAPFIQELAETLEIVNSYYSNRMEGNPTRISEIFLAQQGKWAATSTERNYQQEHLAHIKTSKILREVLRKDSSISPTDKSFLQMLHREFYNALPEAMRHATLISGKTIPIVPGSWRDTHASVGFHHAIAVEQLSVCLQEFEHAYDFHLLSSHDRLFALAAAHHRFLWIHPFADGNGRVVRLMSEAMALRMGYEGHHLYSISRGLARRRKEYDHMLSAADAPRWNDLDGRGNLSLKGLIEFSEFFLDVLNDQIEFMAHLMSAPLLHSRFKRFLTVLQTEGAFSGSECAVLAHLLRLGEMRRGEIQSVSGVERRQASKIASHLLQSGYVQSSSAKGPLRLKIHQDMMHALFPEFFE